MPAGEPAKNMAADPGYGFRGLEVSRRSGLSDRPTSRWNPTDTVGERLAAARLDALHHGHSDPVALGKRRDLAAHLVRPRSVDGHRADSGRIARDRRAHYGRERTEANGGHSSAGSSDR